MAIARWWVRTSTQPLGGGGGRETAKLLPRGESPWWRDEGRHLLILCLFSIRGMRLAHMHNGKSREHAHTCRKARAIFKLRYKKKSIEWVYCINPTSKQSRGTLSLKESVRRAFGSDEITTKYVQFAFRQYLILCIRRRRESGAHPPPP